MLKFEIIYLTIDCSILNEIYSPNVHYGMKLEALLHHTKRQVNNIILKK